MHINHPIKISHLFTMSNMETNFGVRDSTHIYDITITEMRKFSNFKTLRFNVSITIYTFTIIKLLMNLI